MIDVWVTVGIQGSGKTTWAIGFCKKTGAFRLEMDQYRNMMGFHAGSPEWSKDKEAMAFECMLSNLVQMVKDGHSVVISNTHLNRNWAKRYKEALRHYEVNWRVADFTDVPLETCLARNAQRQGLENVPEAVIRKAWSGYQRSLNNEQVITEDWLNDKGWEVRSYTGTPGKPKAIICDLDGTLYKMGDRSPYAFWAVDKDAIVKPVHNALKAARAFGYAVILASGRDSGRNGEFRAQTQKVLTRDAVVYEDLFMRSAGDRRKDNQVKHELFWEHIAPDWDVDYILDDRNQVVDTWRAMGLACFQTAPGEF
jgi:Straboviridae polynucleotide kinase